MCVGMAKLVAIRVLCLCRSGSLVQWVESAYRITSQMKRDKTLRIFSYLKASLQLSWKCSPARIDI